MLLPIISKKVLISCSYSIKILTKNGSLTSRSNYVYLILTIYVFWSRLARYSTQHINYLLSLTDENVLYSSHSPSVHLNRKLESPCLSLLEQTLLQFKLEWRSFDRLQCSKDLILSIISRFYFCEIIYHLINFNFGVVINLKNAKIIFF